MDQQTVGFARIQPIPQPPVNNTVTLQLPLSELQQVIRGQTVTAPAPPQPLQQQLQPGSGLAGLDLSVLQQQLQQQQQQLVRGPVQASPQPPQQPQPGASATFAGAAAASSLVSPSNAWLDRTRHESGGSSAPPSPLNASSPPNFMTLSPDPSRLASPDNTLTPGRGGARGQKAGKGEADPTHYKEHRRVSHLSSEQRRRCSIKGAFESLMNLVPSLSHNPNAKISKAAVLQKTAEYCRTLKQERQQMQEEEAILRQEVDTLNNDISACQSQLPATGAPVTRQMSDQLQQMFAEYVRNRTLHNWRFFILSQLFEPLFQSYCAMVSVASPDDLQRTVQAWLDQHCALTALRPTALNSLKKLCVQTPILTDPTKLPEHAARTVIERVRQFSSRPQNRN